MKTTWTCRILLVAVLLFLGVSAARFWSRAGRIRSDIDRWAEELPVDMRVDLSERGTHTTTGVFSCPAACGHGMRLYLLVSGDGGAVSPDEVARELVMTCTIKAGNGEKIYSFPIPGQEALAPYQGQILLGGTPYLGSKTNTLELVVSRGATVLAGRPQRVIALYDVCEVEPLAVWVARGLAIACGIMALALAGVLFVGVTERRNT